MEEKKEIQFEPMSSSRRFVDSLDIEKVMKKAEEKSVAKDNKEYVEIYLRIKKKMIKWSAYGAAVLAALTIGYNIKKMIDEAEIDAGITKTFDWLTGDQNGIVSENTYNDYTPLGEVVTIYQDDYIAEDIYNICKMNEDLLDVALYNVYFDLNYDRLKHMDNIFYRLKTLVSGDQSLEKTNSFLQNTKGFLDYVIKSGFYDRGKDDYYDIVRTVETYRGNFYELSQKSQENIEKLISAYYEVGGRMYREHEEEIREAYENRWRKQ